MLRCAKNRGNTKGGATPAEGRGQMGGGGDGGREGEKKEEQRIMPTTVPFIPELEQRASKPKSRKRNTEITTVSRLKGNGCFNSRYVDSFFFYCFFLFFFLPIVGFLYFSRLFSLFPGLWRTGGRVGVFRAEAQREVLGWEGGGATLVLAAAAYSSSRFHF